jgi:hypothetical protein
MTCGNLLPSGEIDYAELRGDAVSRTPISTLDDGEV